MERVHGLEAHEAERDAAALAHVVRGELELLQHARAVLDVVEAQRRLVRHEPQRARCLLRARAPDRDRAYFYCLVELWRAVGVRAGSVYAERVETWDAYMHA